MNFRFSDEQEILRRTVRAFCQKELGTDPVSAQFSANRFLSQVEELGWLSGGSVDSAIVFEEVGRASLPAASLLKGSAALRAAACVGCAQQAIDDAVRYATERRQFGQPIGKFQAIAHLLADLQVELDAARWLMYRAAWLSDEGRESEEDERMAALACTEALLKSTSDAMRVFGGYGLTLEFPISHRFRQARAFVAGSA